MIENAKKIMSRLEAAGFEARIAGGAVRDMIMGIEPKDFDIATTALPERVIENFDHVIETGIQHGTVTVMMDGVGYEVTTLRVDKNTDGRHAEVEFTDDWYLDASRRDFTMNAMYMDKDGTVYDYFNGQDDINNSRIRFVGDPDARIKEDYLRILRYFRFISKTGFKINHFDLETIRKNRDGLKQISKERIWSELIKILSGKNATYALKDMIFTDVHQIFDGLQFKGKIDRFFDNDYPVMWKVYELFNDHGRFDVEDFIVKLRDNFKISNDEAEYVRVIHTMIYGTRWHVALAYEKHPEIVKELNKIMDLIFVGNLIKDFPNGLVWNVTGKDLIAEGFKPGPEMGKELEKRRLEWVVNF